MTLRVLHLTRDFPPRDNGGLSSAVGDLVAQARTAGLECAVISFDGWRPRSGPPAAPIGEAVPWIARIVSPAQEPEALAFARHFAPDVVHVHDAFLWGFAEEIGAPTVYSLHVAHALIARLRGLSAPTKSERAEAEAIARASCVTVPSRAVAVDMDLVGRAVVLPPTVPAPRAAGGGDRRGVLFVGRFADYKGLIELFAAIDIVVACAPDARFVIAGGLRDNPRSEARWRERFLRGASQRAAEATRFTGWLDRRAVEEEYRAAAILAAPSWYETFGLAVLEGMSHGLAVVASAAGGLNELIVHEENGLLVPPRDPAALAAALLELHAAPDRAQSLGERARAAALARTESHAGTDPSLGALYAALVSGCTPQGAK